MNETSPLGPDTDHYDAAEVMDDVVPQHASAAPLAAKKQTVRAVVRQAQRLRLPPPALEISPANGDVGEVLDLDDVLGEMLGVAGPSNTFIPTVSAGFPVTHGLYRKFKSALPAPKNMRVDTDATHAQFLDAKRAPYLVALDDAVAQGNEENIHAANLRAEVCGEEVPLSLHPASSDKVKCWRDGDEVFCSVRFRGHDGAARIITSSTPFDRHMDEVLGYFDDAGIDAVESMDVAAPLAHVLGGGALVTQITKAASELLAHPEVVAGRPFVGKVTPKCDPAVAAVMMLLQLCHRGNEQACWEAEKLSRTPGSEAVFAAAKQGYTKAMNERGSR
jgi:hypothetical protein